MNDTKSMGLRLPVQAAVDRTPAYGALGDGTGMEASAASLSQLPQNWQQLLNPPIAMNGFANPLFAF
jgi:hypothetical protein